MESSTEASPRVLLLYDNQGHGHRKRAEIVQSIIGGGAGVEILAVSGSELLGASSVSGIVSLWNVLMKTDFHRTADILVNFLIRLFPLPIIEILSTAKFFERLERLAPDAIISTADGFNKAAGQYAKNKGIPFYIVLTEISVFLDIVSPNATHICYFEDTIKAIHRFNFEKAYFSVELDKNTDLRGRLAYVLKYWRDYLPFKPGNRISHDLSSSEIRRNEAACLAAGPLVDRRYFSPKDQCALKKKLNIPDAECNILIASGSIGGAYVRRLLDLLLKRFTRTANVFVVCGGDVGMFQKLKECVHRHTHINVIPLEFVHNLDEYLAISDCTVARPSAGIFIESLVTRTPFVTYRQTPTNDKGTVELIEKYGLGEVRDTGEELVAALEQVLRDKELYSKRIHEFLKPYPKDFDELSRILGDRIRSDLASVRGLSEPGP